MTERATIYTDRERGVIAPEVYGHFIEHLGHCIYDGIWVGKKSKIPNIDGIRQETIDVLKDVKAPLIRWPGGYFADCYDWRDGVGPAEQRPLRFHNCEPNHEEPNQFGTHEFLRLCELTGASPNICVNTATLTAQDAKNWVEYCNHDGRTFWAVQRRRHGRAKPWNVKYWAIGNESYLCHRPQDYVQHFLLWRAYMRQVDPEIQCIASFCAPTEHPKTFGLLDDWFQEAAAGIRDNMELASLHQYAGGGSGDQFTEEEYWRALQALQRYQLRIESFLGTLDGLVGHQRIKLAFDEWGLWHPGASMRDNNCDQPCTQRDALFAARCFHLLQRYPGRVGLAAIAQSVNVLHSLLRTAGERVYRTPTFHVFEMFKEHQGGTAVELLLTSPCRPVADKEQFTTDTTLDTVTASASLSVGKNLFLTMTNADLRESYAYEVNLVGKFNPCKGTIRILAADPHAQNTFDEPVRVKPISQKFTVTEQRFKITLPSCSVAAVEFG